jgi:hypothetical protein
MSSSDLVSLEERLQRLQAEFDAFSARVEALFQDEVTNEEKSPKKRENDAQEPLHRKRGKFFISPEELQKRFQMAGIKVQDMEAGARELFGWTQMSTIEELEDSFGTLMR